MKTLNSTKLAVLGLGLGVALLGVPEPVKALDGPKAGFDYLITPASGNTSFDFGGRIGPVALEGVPTFFGKSDTFVERLNDCVFDVTGVCEVQYIIRGLRLKSIQPVIIPGLGEYEAVVRLDNKATQSPGSLKLTVDGGYSSEDWPVAWMAGLKAIGDSKPIERILRGVTKFDSEGEWVDLNGSFSIVGPLIHQAPRHAHEVFPIDIPLASARDERSSIPEPSTTAGLIFLGLDSLLGIKRNSKQQ